MTTDRGLMERLQEPFHPDDIEWRVGATNGDKTKGLALAYVTNRAIMNRLDDVFGPLGWQNQFKEWKRDSNKGSQLCGIAVKDEDGEWITKWDGADDSDTEAIKGGLSDAMKRAGYQWGIGRYLYNLEAEWVAIKQAGKSYVLAGDPPRLPAWALPEGFQYPSKGGSGRPVESPNSGSNTGGATPPPKTPPASDTADVNTLIQQTKDTYKIYKGGSMDGFDDWYREQREKRGSHQDVLTWFQMAVIKKLYQDFKGSLDGMEEYVTKQKAKGSSEYKIIMFLDAALENQRRSGQNKGA